MPDDCTQGAGGKSGFRVSLVRLFFIMTNFSQLKRQQEAAARSPSSEVCALSRGDGNPTEMPECAGPKIIGGGC